MGQSCARHLHDAWCSVCLLDWSCAVSVACRVDCSRRLVLFQPSSCPVSVDSCLSLVLFLSTPVSLLSCLCLVLSLSHLADGTYKEDAASLYPLAHKAHNHGFVAATGQTCAADYCFHTCSDTSSHCANGKQMCERQSGWSKRQRWRRMRTLTTLTSTLTTTKMVTFILAHPLSCLELAFVKSFLPHASSCRCFRLLHWV